MSSDRNDPLARFKHIQRNATTDDVAGLDVNKAYLAFDTGDRSQERLKIKRIKGETHSPSYRYLMDIMYNGDEGTQIVLVFSFLMVKITGRNMLSLVHSIEDGTCIFIQEFHAKNFPSPSPKDAVIDEIEVVVRKE
ncbi:MAG TPA: hypothetical protein VKY19_14300 [Ktedonosporobacter sp.]|jgi:hypothetical protein|nr:hypothetical protein [Ktedonosporobacter sp.]